MKQYLQLLTYVLDHGERREDRTGTGTVAVFSTQSRYDLTKGFPAITTKKLYWKGVVVELLWFLRGDANIKYLVDNGVHIWDDDAFRFHKELCPDYPYAKEVFLEDVKYGTIYYSLKNGQAYTAGELGPIYGKQWRAWNRCCSKFCSKHQPLDQIKYLIDGIKTNPFSRRHIISAWNAGEIDQMGLPPCHQLVQFYVSNSKKLSCHFYMRSNDLCLGAPFNIASYALLTHMIAQVCNLGVGELIHSVGDAHIYQNHTKAVEEQLSREPLALPQLELNPAIKDIDDFTLDDIKLVNYKYHPPIKAPLSVGLK